MAACLSITCAIFNFSLDTVISHLKDEHYTLIAPEDILEGRVFCVDSHCSDMLVFPPDSRDFILEHDLLHNGHIVMQVGELSPVARNLSSGFPTRSDTNWAVLYHHRR